MNNLHVVTRSGRYPVVDLAAVPRATRHSVRAAWTGERRRVLPGEWYLSGAIVGAYYAPHGLDGPYHIAVLVPDRRGHARREAS